MQFVKFKSSLGTIEIFGDQNGIQSIDINEDQIFRETIIPDILKQSVEQILDYIEGSRKSFTFLLNPKGTEFQYKVWNIVKTIPYGKTTSYLEIAKDYGNANAVRAVAAAIGKNPILIVVPCHRVIGSNGNLVGFSSGIVKKKWLLKKEGFSLQTEVEF
jgi:methylated-DNA-[protein]-cysteine S-methyltransferase